MKLIGLPIHQSDGSTSHYQFNYHRDIMKKIIVSIALFTLMLVAASVAHAHENNHGTADVERLRGLFETVYRFGLRIDTFIVHPMPPELAKAPAKAADWNRQTAAFEGLRAKITAFTTNLTAVLQDDRVTTAELERANADLVVIHEMGHTLIRSFSSAKGPILTRHATFESSFNALVNNENIPVK